MALCVDSHGFIIRPKEDEPFEIDRRRRSEAIHCLHRKHRAKLFNCSFIVYRTAVTNEKHKIYMYAIYILCRYRVGLIIIIRKHILAICVYIIYTIVMIVKPTQCIDRVYASSKYRPYLCRFCVFI